MKRRPPAKAKKTRNEGSGFKSTPKEEGGGDRVDGVETSISEFNIANEIVHCKI